MKIAYNVQVLPIKVGPHDMYYSLVLAWDDEKNLVLIDTGLPFQVEQISQAISEAGFNIENLTHIIITHQDMDHIGGLPGLQELAKSACVVIHEEEMPYFDGRKTPVRIAAREEKYDSLPDEEQEFVGMMKEFFGSLNIKNAKTVRDGDVLPVCGGIKIMHTPGHTPGHMVLHFTQSGIAVCGDALNVNDGRLDGPNPEYTLDMERATAYYEDIKSMGLDGVVAYHGGYFSLAK